MITIKAQTLAIEGLTSITVSDIVPDDESTGYVRKVDFFTDPLDAINRKPVLTLTLTADAQAALQIATPTLKF